MSEEENKAIEWLKNKPQECTSLINSCSYIENKKAYAKDRTMFKAILNLIQKQQEGIEKKEHKYRDLELKYEQNLKMCKHFRKELNKQNEIINEMALNIAANDSNLCQYIDETIRCKKYAGENKLTCDECIKQYFEKKVEEK